MAESLSSVFSSMGAAFHGFPSPVLFNVTASTSSTVHPCKTSTHPDLLITAFENRLATDLRRLIFSDHDECSYLSARWLQQAVDVLCLSAYSRAEELFPLLHIRQVLDLNKDCQVLDLNKNCSKWVNRYLEDTISLLDVCNVVKNRISKITDCLQFLQIAIHCFNGAENTGEVQLWRARSALADCLSAMNLEAEERSDFNKCKSSLKRIGELSHSGASSSSVAEFVGVMNMCRATVVFVCSVVVAALSFEPATKRSFPLLANKYTGSWPSGLLNLHRGMKEDCEKRESKLGIALLLEVGMADEAARSLHSLLDKFLKNKSFPLSKDDAFQLKQEISRLKRSAHDLKDGLDGLDKRMSELFRSIITCRVRVLDMLTYSQL